MNVLLVNLYVTIELFNKYGFNVFIYNNFINEPLERIISKDTPLFRSKSNIYPFALHYAN